jgi:D-glycero-D-manno-heptose 1,7-bisphosphate phosphatase
VFDALTSLKTAGFYLIGATNQPDVARGKTPRALVESFNAKLMNALPLDELMVCYHDDVENCDCRKPKPGLLFSAAEKYQLSLQHCFMIGDRWRDIEAGQQANCKTIWLDYQYDEKKPQNPNFVTTTLEQAAKWIMSQPE